MSNSPKINTFKHIVPMIYAYNTPEIKRHDGWTKIGYTENGVKQRLDQQSHTIDAECVLAWQDNAMYKDGSGEYFKDHAFHSFLQRQKGINRLKGKEWFEIDGPQSLLLFNEFASRKPQTISEGEEYILREEQQDAVNLTKDYFESGGKEFLWNAKPRFGKTLATYDLIKQMGVKNVLILTNRPSIANSWFDDYKKFIAWEDEYAFVTDRDSFKYTEGAMTRDEFKKTLNSKGGNKGMIAFESLPNLKGGLEFGGNTDKLGWIKDLHFDLLVIDEAHEGVETSKTKWALDNIGRDHTLFLSGTPFRYLEGTDKRFGEGQIFNWTYADEQQKKAEKAKDTENYNPYEELPQLNMFTYQMSNMIQDEIKKGIILEEDEDPKEFAFDLNEFFSTDNNGKFVYEDEVKKFLHSLYTGKKYPFSTPELRDELSHTLWILDRVNSAKALARLLEEDEVFKDYKIVLAAGDGDFGDERPTDIALDKSFDLVQDAIANNDKTITLTVGKLTVGVTVPEWSGVLVLSNMKSPSAYMQAAFRAQNPCLMRKDEKVYRKENAYVFDFDPARTLDIYEQFANNLSLAFAGGSGTGSERMENVKTLLNFFPVLGEDDEGEMVALDAEKVLTIPRKIKSLEVVKRGFMSNFLFQNIANVFHAPEVVKEILEQMEKPIKESPAPTRKKRKVSDYKRDDVDETGNIQVPNPVVEKKTEELFGDKIYKIGKERNDKVRPVLEKIGNDSTDKEVKGVFKKASDIVKKDVREKIIEPVVNEIKDRSLKARARKQIERAVDRKVNKQFEEIQKETEQKKKIAKANLGKELLEADSSPEKAKKAQEKFRQEITDINKSAVEQVTEDSEKETEAWIKEAIIEAQKVQREADKRKMEDDIRDRLRGLTRTIPSFIMAYGDRNLKLSNFDDYTDDDVFEEVTGITEEQFRFLRDGGDYTDNETGQTKHFNGQLFDEIVFDDSIQEFLNIKERLANYFEENQEEDIFDYIPNQKTNQIFTPKWVVKKMVDELEENNPGCFDDPDATFADLYMKSGLYLTEIVKRLFKSEKMKEAIPDDEERIRHILHKQVYGMAPSEIIYLIATNYILGFDENLKAEKKNFVVEDAAKAAKEGNLQELVNKHFDKGE